MEPVKLKPAGLYKSDDNKIFRKLPTSEAAAADNPVRGEVTRGEGDKAKTVKAFFEEVKTNQ